MINHIVLFKLKDYSEDEKPRIIDEMKSLLEGLKGKIEELKYIEVGVNYELNSKSYDLVLISHFDSVEDLDKYRFHAEHKKVLNRFAELRLERAAVDFEF
ncbi:MAG: Dabb family protein [Bacteroidales bacterium]|nr:Dabb family protein [Bacteroidales bacterium]